MTTPVPPADAVTPSSAAAGVVSGAGERARASRDTLGSGAATAPEWTRVESIAIDVGLGVVVTACAA